MTQTVLTALNVIFSVVNLWYFFRNIDTRFRWVNLACSVFCAVVALSAILSD